VIVAVVLLLGFCSCTTVPHACASPPEPKPLIPCTATTLDQPTTGIFLCVWLTCSLAKANTSIRSVALHAAFGAAEVAAVVAFTALNTALALWLGGPQQLQALLFLPPTTQPASVWHALVAVVVTDSLVRCCGAIPKLLLIVVSIAATAKQSDGAQAAAERAYFNSLARSLAAANRRRTTNNNNGGGSREFMSSGCSSPLWDGYSGEFSGLEAWLDSAADGGGGGSTPSSSSSKPSSSSSSSKPSSSTPSSPSSSSGGSDGGGSVDRDGHRSTTRFISLQRRWVGRPRHFLNFGHQPGGLAAAEGCCSPHTSDHAPPTHPRSVRCGPVALADSDGGTAAAAAADGVAAGAVGVGDNSTPATSALPAAAAAALPAAAAASPHTQRTPASPAVPTPDQDATNAHIAPVVANTAADADTAGAAAAAAAAASQSPASAARRRARLLEFVECALAAYRGALPIATWQSYLLAATPSAPLNILITGGYLAYKLSSLLQSGRLLLLASRVVMRTGALYGRPLRAGEEAGPGGDAPCPICQDAACVPVLLDCSHVFCCDCLEEWLEREATCPMCRALVKPEGARGVSGDGTTTLLPQLF